MSAGRDERRKAVEKLYKMRLTWIERTETEWHNGGDVLLMIYWVNAIMFIAWLYIISTEHKKKTNQKFTVR